MRLDPRRLSAHQPRRLRGQRGQALRRLVREAEAAGERWQAFYHSHIDCGAYFSAEDRKYAAPEGAAVFPEVVQLVIACSAQAITEAKAFLWDGHGFALVQDLPEFARTRP